MSDIYYLGIDLGTSGVKGLILNQQGKVIHKSFFGYSILSEQLGYAEQKAKDWLYAVFQVSQSLLKNIAISSLRGVGFSGQLNGFVLLDKQKNLLRTPIIWLDGRAEKEVSQLIEREGRALEKFAYNKLDKIAILPKLLWLKNHEPHLLEKAETILFVKDYVIYRLTGEISTDFSDASCTFLYDFNRQDWNKTILKKLGINPNRIKLPPISPSSQVIGRVTPQGEQTMGIPQGIPVVAGAGDAACLTVGSGVDQTGAFGLTLGTGGHMVTVSPQLFRETIGNHWQMQHLTTNEYILLGLIQNCGLVVNWWRKLLSISPNLNSKELSFDDLSKLAKQSRPGANGTFFLPFLSGSAPPIPPVPSKGMFYGLSSTHSASDMTQAIFEGIAFNIRDCVEAYQKLGFEVKHIMVGEGGSQNPYWLQVISNILNVRLYPLQEIDASALGAALIAWSGIENIPLSEAIATSVRPKSQENGIHPDLETVDLYDEKYHKYQKLITDQQD